MFIEFETLFELLVVFDESSVRVRIGTYAFMYALRRLRHVGVFFGQLSVS